MKHFFEMTQEQIEEMAKRCAVAVADYANEQKIGHLSGNNHNVYEAIFGAIYDEWIKGKK